MGEVDAIRKEEYVGEKADQLAPNVSNPKQPLSSNVACRLISEKLKICLCFPRERGLQSIRHFLEGIAKYWKV